MYSYLFSHIRRKVLEKVYKRLKKEKKFGKIFISSIERGAQRVYISEIII